MFMYTEEGICTMVYKLYVWEKITSEIGLELLVSFTFINIFYENINQETVSSDK